MGFRSSATIRATSRVPKRRLSSRWTSKPRAVRGFHEGRFRDWFPSCFRYLFGIVYPPLCYGFFTPSPVAQRAPPLTSSFGGERGGAADRAEGARRGVSGWRAAARPTDRDR